MDIVVKPKSVYSHVEEEFDAATNDVALVDRSSVGRVEVTGADRLDLLHRLSTNDLIKGTDNRVIGTVLTTEKGRVVDFVQVLVMPDCLLLLVSPKQEDALMRWVEKFTITEDINLKGVTASTAMYSLLGPQAVAAASKLLMTQAKKNEWVFAELAKTKVLVSWRDEFLTSMVDIIILGDNKPDLWERISFEARSHGIRTMENTAYETFRISRGIPLAGREVSEAFNPYEIGLQHMISYTKGCYVGQEVIARLNTYQKVQKELVGIVLDRKPDDNDFPRLMIDGVEIGIVTSVSPVPIRGKYVGLAVVRRNAITFGVSIPISSGKGNDARGVLHQFPIKV